MERKHIRDLILRDFDQFEVWVWEDDDADHVVGLRDYAHALEDNDAIFCRCEIALYDESFLIGMASVRCSDCEVYLIGFDSSSGLISLPLQDQLRDHKHLEDVCLLLGKSEREIFPLTIRLDIGGLDIKKSQIVEFPYLSA